MGRFSANKTLSYSRRHFTWLLVHVFNFHLIAMGRLHGRILRDLNISQFLRGSLTLNGTEKWATHYFLWQDFTQLEDLPINSGLTHVKCH